MWINAEKFAAVFLWIWSIVPLWNGNSEISIWKIWGIRGVKLRPTVSWSATDLEEIQTMRKKKVNNCTGQL